MNAATTERAPSAEVALLIDRGSAWSKANVIGRVRGRWRVVAHAAQPTEWGIESLERSLADQLAVSGDARLRTDGARLVAGATRIECHTAQRPARLGIVAVTRDLSGAAARRAAESAGWDVVVQASVDDGRPTAERLTLLRGAEPDAWLVAGGFEDGADDATNGARIAADRGSQALEAAALVAASRRESAIPVLWAGSERLHARVAGLFEPGSVTSVPNPRPDARREELGGLRDRLEEILRATVEAGNPIHLAPIAFRRATASLARVANLSVTAIDVGARHATRVDAAADGHVEGRVMVGGLVGTGGPSLAQRLARGLGHLVDEASAADILRNVHARPASLPHTDDELIVTQAAARALVAGMVDEHPITGVDLLLGAGRVVAAAQPGAAAQILLDGARPLGVTQLAVDAAGVLGPLGALPRNEIAEGISLLSDDVIMPLGTAVVCRGGEPGRPAMRVTVHRAGWPDPAPVEVRVGQIQLLPLARGEEAELVIELADGISLGGPRRASRVHASATGGPLGLILDARGVPLVLPRRNEDRQAVLGGWRDLLMRGPAIESRA